MESRRIRNLNFNLKLTNISTKRRSENEKSGENERHAGGHGSSSHPGQEHGALFCGPGLAVGPGGPDRHAHMA